MLACIDLQCVPWLHDVRVAINVARGDNAVLGAQAFVARARHSHPGVDPSCKLPDNAAIDSRVCTAEDQPGNIHDLRTCLGIYFKGHFLITMSHTD